MAIDTLAKLKTRLAFLANRDDLFDDVVMSPATIDGEITVAIENATRTISRDLARRGGTGLQEVVTTSLTTTAGLETFALPTGFAGFKSFAIMSDPVRVLLPATMDSLLTEFPSAATNKPSKYATVAQTTAYLRPIPDSAYATRLITFKNLVALTDSVTNPIFDAHPDIYEAAGMVEIALSLEDEAAASRWRVVYDQKVNDMTGQDQMSGWAAAMSGASPSVQVTIA